jgi:hypothetical protein
MLTEKNLDQLYQIYESICIPVYLIFDNDRGEQQSDLRPEFIKQIIEKVKSIGEEVERDDQQPSASEWNEDEIPF